MHAMNLDSNGVPKPINRGKNPTSVRRVKEMLPKSIFHSLPT